MQCIIALKDRLSAKRMALYVGHWVWRPLYIVTEAIATVRIVGSYSKNYFKKNVIR